MEERARHCPSIHYYDRVGEWGVAGGYGDGVVSPSLLDADSIGLPGCGDRDWTALRFSPCRPAYGSWAAARHRRQLSAGKERASSIQFAALVILQLKETV